MDTSLLGASLYTIKAIAILDNDGERIISKFYDDTFPTVKEQKEFEKNLFNKTHKANAEIIMLDGLTCVYRSNVDLFFYVIGSSQENELILVSVLNCLYEVTSQILRKNIEKRALFDHLDSLYLAIDEIVDGGIILEADPAAILPRLAMKGEEMSEPNFKDAITSKLEVGQRTMKVFQTAKDQFGWLKN